MRKKLLFILSVLLVLLCVTVGAAEDKPTYWTLKPKADELVPSGKLAVVKGKTNSVGVHFQIKDLSIQQPVALQLMSVDSEKVLKVCAFKNEPDQPLITRETDEKGVAQLNFRTGETMYFRVTSSGTDLVDYQLAVVVGPEIIPDPPDVLVSAKELGKPAAKEEPKMTEPVTKSDTTGQSPTAVPDENTQSGFQTMVVVSLFLIFAALVAVVIVLVKRNPRTGGTLLLIISFTYLTGIPPAAGKTTTVNNTRLGPPPPSGLVSHGDMEDPTKDFIVKTNTLFSDYKKADGSVQNMIKRAKLFYELMEYFEIIDGKEKLIQANFSPRGMPKLPSSFKGEFNPSAKRSMKFNEINDKIKKAHKFLENNFVVYKQTMITTGRIKNLQKAAANMNSFAQLALMVHGQATEGEKKFSAKYDGAVQNGLEHLDAALKEMDQFERKEYGFDNWYAYYGIQYYNFMLSRYSRK